LSETNAVNEVRPCEERPKPADTRSISTELLSAVMSLIPDAAIVADGDGRIVSGNQRAERLFGYLPGSLIGLPIEELVPERARRRHRGHRSAFLVGPQDRPMGAGLELTGRRRDGSEFPLDISLAPIVNAGERLVVAAIRDVTEQRRATASQAELAAIVRSSLDAIISTALEGHITSWNPAAEELLGYRRADIVGEHISTLVPEHASAVFEELLEEAAMKGHPGALDTQWRHRDGHEIEVAVSVSPLKDQSGSLLGFSAVARDITERKAIERDLRHLLVEEERLQRQHAATAEIRLALLSGASIEEALTLICARASELVDAPEAVICVKDADGVRIAAAVGWAAEMVGTTLPPGLSFAEQVIDRGEPIEISQRSESSLIEVPKTLPDGPTFGVPIITDGAARGSLTFVRKPGGPAFDAAVRVFAEVFGTQAALAFELERARKDRDEMALVGDRERIARDLHDHVIQRLFAAGMGLQGSLALVAEPRARQKVSEAVVLLDATIREIRNTIFGIARPDGHHPLLRSQVVELAQEARSALGFEPWVGFEGAIDAGVPDRVGPHVLACVREALSNVARHAGARTVRVELVMAEGTLVVAVTDDGVGFRPSARSSGLANLDERARLLGGSLEVSTHPGGGTRLQWSVPIGP